MSAKPQLLGLVWDLGFLMDITLISTLFTNIICYKRMHMVRRTEKFKNYAVDKHTTPNINAYRLLIC